MKMVNSTKLESTTPTQLHTWKTKTKEINHNQNHSTKTEEKKITAIPSVNNQGTNIGN